MSHSVATTALCGIRQGYFMKYSETDIREEHGYRRGFDQGMYIAIKMFKEGKTHAQIDATKKKVHKWRYNGKYGKSDIRIEPPVKF